jgi:hypothetical protein
VLATGPPERDEEDHALDLLGEVLGARLVAVALTAQRGRHFLGRASNY